MIHIKHTNLVDLWFSNSYNPNIFILPAEYKTKPLSAAKKLKVLKDIVDLRNRGKAERDSFMCVECMKAEQWRLVAAY